MTINVEKTLGKMGIDVSLVDVVDITDNTNYFTFSLQCKIQYQVDVLREDVVFDS